MPENVPDRKDAPHQSAESVYVPDALEGTLNEREELFMADGVCDELAEHCSDEPDGGVDEEAAENTAWLRTCSSALTTARSHCQGQIVCVCGYLPRLPSPHFLVDLEAEFLPNNEVRLRKPTRRSLGSIRVTFEGRSWYVKCDVHTVRPETTSELLPAARKIEFESCKELKNTVSFRTFRGKMRNNSSVFSSLSVFFLSLSVSV